MCPSPSDAPQPPPPPAFAPRPAPKRSRTEDDAVSSTKRLQSDSGRSYASQSGRSFSSQTREHLKRLYHKQCWFCQAPGKLACCHVVPRQDQANFRSLRRLGLVNLQAASDTENALYLCGSCHPQYDDQFCPQLVIVPKHLDYFFTAELLWQADFPKTGQARVPPTPATYLSHCEEQHSEPGMLQAIGGLYKAYMDVNFLPPSSNPLHACERQWHGDPMAIVYRAIQAAYRIVQPTHFPADVRTSILQLHALYEKGNALLRQDAQLERHTSSSAGAAQGFGHSDAENYPRPPAPNSSTPGSHAPQSGGQPPPPFGCPPAHSFAREASHSHSHLVSPPPTASPGASRKRKRDDTADVNPVAERPAKRQSLPTLSAAVLKEHQLAQCETTGMLQSFLEVNARRNDNNDPTNPAFPSGDADPKVDDGSEPCPADGADGKSSLLTNSSSARSNSSTFAKECIWRWSGPGGTSASNIERWKGLLLRADASSQS
ncbi:hypothetical protein BU26DRAFT_525025 [Trematosphaeria pertusa]|uniref:HNH nuclease domain-containing protein n=1 Tax=Trematosphaeria pertusa TaxID=390896 RepID=A0A6A6HUR0_9PLEO|nr:uncharacterized protein BU26DRAFT_525025 [Trematosphaeria pertusa]KAF2241498.1 hypothetical protein BU26DRAFT_525025 [Trematosphaeria pertusa]